MDFREFTKKLWDIYLLEDKENICKMADMVTPDCVTIGTGKHEFYQSREKFLEALRSEIKEREDIHFNYRNFWCEDHKISEDVVLVYGEFCIFWESDDKGVSINMDSRFTFLYKRIEGEWKLVHIHESVPNRDQMDGEYYPKTLTGQVERLNHKIDSLTSMAERDGLTDLLNYRALQAQYENYTAEHAWLMMIDLDNFKYINDTYGHLVGDQTLVKMAKILNNAVRSNDYVFRLGGDEFLILCGGMGDREIVKKILDRLMKRVQEAALEEEAWTSISVGVTKIIPGEALSSAMGRADKALYSVKESGKRNYAIH